MVERISSLLSLKPSILLCAISTQKKQALQHMGTYYPLDVAPSIAHQHVTVGTV